MKKRFLAILLAIVMCLAMAAPAFAADSDFTIENGVLKKYNGSGGDVVIPDGVTCIGSEAFFNCYSLTSVTIPLSVTSIEVEAFAFCMHVTDVYYGGNEAQWAAIEIEEGITPSVDGATPEEREYEGNNALFKATMHYSGTSSDQAQEPTNFPTVENIPATGTAVATTQTVKLDGRDVQFQYYAVKDANGNETNYVKIRDLALALNGTKAQFNVGWDGKISITSNTAYEVKGGEGTTPYSGSQPYTAVSDTPVSFNGSDVKLTSFSITYQGGGYTYYKLRDLGQLLNFEVRWDNSSKSIVIETDKPYTGN